MSDNAERHHEPERRNQDVAFEHSDIRSIAVTGTGIAVLLGTLVIVFLMYFLFEYFRNTHPNPAPQAELGPEFSRIRQPLLQASPRSDLQSLRARDLRLLEHYNWVDRQKGTVSIPVDKAIDKLLTQGMPATGDYSDLKLFPPRGGNRETGFDLVEGAGQP